MSTNVEVVKYPYDPTGNAITNRIINERRTVGREYNRALAPYAGPYYSDSMVVTDAITAKVLVRDYDYKLLYPEQEAELRIGKPVCTMVQILNLDHTDVNLTYQVVGGPYSTSVNVIGKLLNEIQQDNRPVRWDDILGKPTEFNPSKHLTSATDLYGLEYVVMSLEDIVQAIYQGDVSSHDVLYDYIERIKKYLDDNLNDLHNMDNELAARIEAVNVRVDSTNLDLKALGDRTDKHIGDKDNPHNTTKAQVGLGAVENYRPATQPEAEAGTANEVVMTALRTWQAITKFNTLNIDPKISSHIANRNNPHGVTAAQVGLGAVANVRQVQQGGGVNMLNNTVQIGWSAGGLIAQVDSTQLGRIYTSNNPDPAVASHANRRDNPHGVTAAQVGLGNVPNWGAANEGTAAAGWSNNTFASPLSIRRFHEAQRTISWNGPGSTNGFSGDHIWYQLG
ncbi:virion-associated protein [Serratia phage Moabite]|uniref:Virion-associated protein n=1 Tax=Serratia phage Moabite TaxID=2587814 RepID=A0A4Y5TPA2_9CAUD|nr:virion structural protein [Serratia phage Moabite]QDB71176.1 virion-associated protein [Serratia phage Moabite]UCR74676.1 virion-associated protein [Serratia phage BUCT660]UGO54031.1 putative YomR [Serratia phage vB_SmaM_Haymo]URG14244.1 virion structural protein [Pectobacterium phage vB_ParM-25]